MPKKSIFLFALVFFILTNPAFAQNTQELHIDSNISGTLRVGQEILYIVNPNENGILVVETSGNTDTYLEAFRIVQDSDIRYITKDDDSGEDFNASVSIVVKSGSSYLIKLRCYNSNISGEYNIFAYMEPMPVITALRPGQAQNSSIASGEHYWYSVIAPKNGILTAETTGRTDTYLEAYDENFDFLAEDDDSGKDLNAKIELNVTEDKTYYFKLMGFNVNVHGPYRFSVNIK